MHNSWELIARHDISTNREINKVQFSSDYYHLLI
jgi:hypothetical protein